MVDEVENSAGLPNDHLQFLLLWLVYFWFNVNASYFMPKAIFSNALLIYILQLR